MSVPPIVPTCGTTPVLSWSGDILRAVYVSAGKDHGTMITTDGKPVQLYGPTRESIFEPDQNYTVERCSKLFSGDGFTIGLNESRDFITKWKTPPNNAMCWNFCDPSWGPSGKVSQFSVSCEGKNQNLHVLVDDGTVVSFPCDPTLKNYEKKVTAIGCGDDFLVLLLKDGGISVLNGKGETRYDTDAVKIAAGGYRFLFIERSGYVWEQNFLPPDSDEKKAAGIPYVLRKTGFAAPRERSFVDLTVGKIHNAGLLDDGTVVEWPICGEFDDLKVWYGLPPIRQISAGGERLIALAENGEVYVKILGESVLSEGSMVKAAKRR